MRIFITGATGYIGRAVAHELAANGHAVAALAHRPETGTELRAAGYEPVPGDLRSPSSWIDRLDDVDAVVHAGAIGGEDAALVDDAVTRALSDRLEGTGRALVYTSGVWVLGNTHGSFVDERSPTRPIELVAWRASLEQWLMGAAARGVRAVIVRPGIVFGRGGGIPGMLGSGALPVVGDGAQEWPLVHVDDLAVLYRLAVERAPARTILHGVSSHAPMADVARAMGAETIREVSRDDAQGALGPFAEALALDQRIDARATRVQTGWQPVRPWPRSTTRTSRRTCAPV